MRLNFIQFEIVLQNISVNPSDLLIKQKVNDAFG